MIVYEIEQEPVFNRFGIHVNRYDHSFDSCHMFIKDRCEPMQSKFNAIKSLSINLLKKKMNRMDYMKHYWMAGP